jgi:RNA polymerase sigma-70 factor (ECF subfamily)
MLRVLPRPDPDGVSDAVLVAAAREQDVHAQEALVRKHGLMLNRLCFRLLGSREDLDDLVQETFLRAFGALKTLDRPEAFRGWLAEIAVRTAHNLIRKRRLMSRLGLRTSQPIVIDELIAPAAPLEAMLALRAIYRILEALPPKTRIALVLRRVEGRQLDEVAQLMDASLASVKRWLAQADRALAAERGAWEVEG